MRRVTELLVPQGTLVVEQVFMELTSDDAIGPVTVALRETSRTAYLDGSVVYWRPETRDLLTAADDALALLPPPLPVPVITAGR